MSYRCLSALLSVYPNAWNVQEVIDNEGQILEEVHNSILFQMQKSNKTIALDIFNRNAQATMKLYEKVKTTGKF